MPSPQQVNFRVRITPLEVRSNAIEIRVSIHRKLQAIFALLDLSNHVDKHTDNPGKSQGKGAKESGQKSRVCTAFQEGLPEVVPRHVPHAEV